MLFFCLIFCASVFAVYDFTLNPHINVRQVLNTVFWLGKAAGGCPSYSGPSLNLKEFEGLLAQMKVVSEHRAEDIGGRRGQGDGQQGR